MRRQQIACSSGGLRMEGTLTVPEATGPFPCVLMVCGSGQVDRDENHPRMRLNVFADLATHLAGRSIASFRYDKRGVGVSEGDFWTAGFHDNVAGIEMPVFAITGAKDLQVDPDDIELMRALVQAPFEGHVLPDVTHLLRVEHGEPSLDTYKKQIKRPLDAGVVELILEWLERRVKSNGTI